MLSWTCIFFGHACHPFPYIAGECGVKVTECTSEMTDLAETQDDPCVDRIKRAALTALSAAAVKSKLLADQEEDEVRQLATFLIEKQVL